MKRTIKLNENILKALIAEAIFENIGGYRDNYKDFPAVVEDFVKAYKTEGPDGPNTTKHYYEIVATFKEEGKKHLKHVTLRDNHNDEKYGKLGGGEYLNEIYLSLFLDKNINLLKQHIVDTFDENGVNGVKNYLKTILYNRCIDYYRGTSEQDDAGEWKQIEVPAAVSRKRIGDEDKTETDAILQSNVGIDYGENKVNNWLEMIKKALLAHKKGEFEYKYSYTGLFLYAYYLTIGNVKKDGEQPDTTPKLNDEILNTFNKILQKHGKNPVTPNAFLQIRNRFKEQDAQRIVDTFGPESTNMNAFGNDRSSTASGDRDIAENKLRKIIRESIISFLKK